jgi:hypothetical protein
MPNNFALDLKSSPFVFAGQRITGIMFVTGEEWTKIGLDAGCHVDKDGCVVFRTTPEQARAVGKNLIDNADKDQRRLFLRRR